MLDQNCVWRHRIWRNDVRQGVAIVAIAWWVLCLCTVYVLSQKSLKNVAKNMIKFDIFDHTHLWSTIWGPQNHCANMKKHFGSSRISDFRWNFLPCFACKARKSYDSPRFGLPLVPRVELTCGEKARTNETCIYLHSWPWRPFKSDRFFGYFIVLNYSLIL